jgi:hypothetical protein
LVASIVLAERPEALFVVVHREGAVWHASGTESGATTARRATVRDPENDPLAVEQLLAEIRRPMERAPTLATAHPAGPADDGGLLESPWFWVSVAVVGAGAGAALGVALHDPDHVVVVTP